MKIKNYTFRKALGGISITTSILLLLIGLTNYEQIFSSTKYDLIKSSEYAKTAIQQASKKHKQTTDTLINLDDEGDIIKIYSTPEGELIKHYRAVHIPELVNNYEDLPHLYLETIKGNDTFWKEVDIYKVDREKGLIYFLLKVERDHLTLPTGLYTGRYKVELIR